jgi:DNA polymerase V
MPVFGLIDGNSFYCSCERAFDPKLWGRPVVVLSNNDGCCIARSDESKQLGIRMGAPWHLIRGLPANKGVAAFSSNYALYADQSRRIYQVLHDFVPAVEPYSIDEMFMDLTGLPDLLALCHRLRETVRRIAKIPTCIGIGPSKTIAKLANRVAKAQPGMSGICDLRDADIRRALYRVFPVSEVWGIGGKTAEKLNRIGIMTIEDFLRLDHQAVRDMLTVVGARVQAELRGTSCLPLSMMLPAKKGIAVTRTFGRIVTEWADLREAVAAYATRAGEKLRAEGLQAVTMLVFLHTNPHSDDPHYSAQRSARIEPTNDTRALIGEALRLLQALWRPGFRYYKAGIMLTELVALTDQPVQLFPTRDPAKSARAMAALDPVNARFGRDTLRPLATGLTRSWRTRAGNLSPRYTTNINEILNAQAF